MCIDIATENNGKNRKFEVGDLVKISKHKNIFVRWYISNWSEEFFAIKKLKNIVLWTYLIEDRHGEEIARTFYGKELQKTYQTEFRTEKVIKKKGNNFYANWKIFIPLTVGLTIVLKNEVSFYKMGFFHSLLAKAKIKKSWIMQQNLIGKMQQAQTHQIF